MKWRVVMSKKIAPLRAFNRIIKPRTFIYLSSRMSGKTEMARKEFERRQKDIECVKTTLKNHNQLQIDYDEMNRINDELNLGNHQLRDENIKLRKALEIIKNKNPDLCLLKTASDFQHYMDLCAMRNEITQEEYDLLKEILE